MDKTPGTLTEAIRYFSNPDNCISFLVERRWPDGEVVCPVCGRHDASQVKGRPVWQCKTRHPKNQFSIKVGTIFEDSALPLDKWLIVMWMLANCKNGISSYEIMKAVGVTQKSAWHMLHRVRLALRDYSTGQLGSEGGPVEIDECFIGGKLEKMHKGRADKLRKMYRGENKTPVMGILDRATRQVRTRLIPDVNRETLQAEILKHVQKGSTIYTDAHTGYGHLNQETSEFVHDTVSHMREYVRSQVHTNGIEGYWSLLHRTLTGTYVAVEPFHLGACLDEQAFRYNNRATKDNPLTDADRFVLAVTQIVGRRLTYAGLTGKESEKPEVD